MPSPREIVRHSLINYPSLYDSGPVKVLDHLFAVIGNGFEWDENGELSRIDYGDPEVATVDYSDIENHEQYLAERRARYAKYGPCEAMEKLARGHDLEMSAARAKRDWLAANLDAILDAPLTKLYFPGSRTSYVTQNISTTYAKAFTFPDNITKEWAELLFAYLSDWLPLLAQTYGPQTNMDKAWDDTPWWPENAIEGRAAIVAAQHRLWPLYHDGQSYADHLEECREAMAPVMAILKAG